VSAIRFRVPWKRKGERMSALTDIWNTILHILHSADTITLVIMAVVAIGAGFLMQELGSLVTTTIGALVVFAVVNFIRAIALQHADASALAQADWHVFGTMQMLLVLAYFIIFTVVIAIVSQIRSVAMG
jgi:hypothetical protein